MSTQAELAVALQEFISDAGSLLYSTGSGFAVLTPGTDAEVLTLDAGLPVWAPAEAAGAVADFTDLGDVPTSYTGQASKFLKVKADESGVEFVAGSTTAVAWGSITGTLASQSDLNSALAAKQPLDATLTALAGVTTAADKLIYATGADTFATTTLSSFARTLLDDADAAAARVTLGVTSSTNNEVNLLDYGAVANCVIGPGATLTSGTDNSAALDAAIATGKPIYVPAGNYYIASGTTRYNMQWANIYGPGIFYGLTNTGYTKLGKTLQVGTTISHEVGSVGGLHIGAEGGNFGMRMWMGHHNWMQVSPARYGAPVQFQLYTSCMFLTATPVSPNRLNAVYGTFNTSELFVGDYIGWNGQLYVVATVSSSYITVNKAFVGTSPGWATDATLEKPVYKSYETARGICNVSGTTVTWVSGDWLIPGYSGDHMYVFINGTKYTITAGPETAGTNKLTLSSSAGTLTNATFAMYRQYAPWAYVALQRWQGVQGGKEAVGNIWLNTRNEFVIAGGATHESLLPNMRIESPRIRIGGGEWYPWGATDNRYTLEITAPMNNLSYGAHFASIGGVAGKEAVKVVTWDHTDHLTLYGSVSGVNDGPAIYAEGSSTNLDLFLNPKGSGKIRFGTWTANADAAINGYVYIKDFAGNLRKLATIA